MELVIKKYNELTLNELYGILRIRSEVFVVEQNCVYQDVDDLDQDSIHIYLRDEEGMQAYLRVIEAGKAQTEVAIGRVLVHPRKRRCGLATKILLAGIEVAKNHMNAAKIKIEAQTYAKSLYENVGFKQCSDEFLEDGIPHIEMILDMNEKV